VGGNLLPEEHGGEMADVGSFGRAEVVDERGHHLRVARQPPDLLLRLPPRVVVRHQKLDQQQLQRLRHSSRLIQPLPAGPSLPSTAIRRRQEQNLYRFGGVVAQVLVAARVGVAREGLLVVTYGIVIISLSYQFLKNRYGRPNGSGKNTAG
jgi:hypothetical protein